RRFSSRITSELRRLSTPSLEVRRCDCRAQIIRQRPTSGTRAESLLRTPTPSTTSLPPCQARARAACSRPYSYLTTVKLERETCRARAMIHSISIDGPGHAVDVRRPAGVSLWPTTPGTCTVLFDVVPVTRPRWIGNP